MTTTLVENSLQKDAKRFWSYVQERKGQNMIPPKMTYDDVSYNQSQDKIISFAAIYHHKGVTNIVVLGDVL
jgi:hypothetical protein